MSYLSGNHHSLPLQATPFLRLGQALHGLLLARCHAMKTRPLALPLTNSSGCDTATELPDSQEPEQAGVQEEDRLLGVFLIDWITPSVKAWGLVCVFICVCVCVHVYIYMDLHAYVCLCIFVFYAYVYICVSAWICECVCMCASLCLCVYVSVIVYM